MGSGGSAAAAMGAAPLKVLLADGGGAVTSSLVVLLASWGHDVTVVRDGIEALRAARAWAPDVVVASARLPRMDGLSVLAAVRAGGGPSAAEVVLVGASGDAHARARAVQIGAAGFLASPIAAGELLRLLGAVAGRRAAARAGSR